MQRSSLVCCSTSVYSIEIITFRDTRTHLPLPGVQAGDLGIKVGWNFIDHGWLILNNVRVPRSSLLDKYQVLLSNFILF